MDGLRLKALGITDVSTNAHAIAKQCANAITSSTNLGLPCEQSVVMLVIPKGWKPPPKFPRGVTACWRGDESRVVYFNAMNVLAWLAAHNLVKVEAAVTQPKESK